MSDGGVIKLWAEVNLTLTLTPTPTPTPTPTATPIPLLTYASPCPGCYSPTLSGDKGPVGGRAWAPIGAEQPRVRLLWLPSLWIYLL